MLTHLAALTLSLGLLADPSAPASPAFPLDSAGTSRDFDKPPRGSPADQALWRAAYEADNAIVIEQHAAALLATQARTNTERLKDPAARGGVTAQRADELAKPLVARWTANVELMASTWPVSKVRGCRYELLNFESALLATDARASGVAVDDARRDLNVCLDKITRVLKQVRQANEELRAANAEAERALGPPPAAPKTTAAAPAPAPAKQ